MGVAFLPVSIYIYIYIYMFIVLLYWLALCDIFTHMHTHMCEYEAACVMQVLVITLLVRYYWSLHRIDILECEMNTNVFRLYIQSTGVVCRQVAVALHCPPK